MEECMEEKALNYQESEGSDNLSFETFSCLSVLAEHELNSLICQILNKIPQDEKGEFKEKIDKNIWEMQIEIDKLVTNRVEERLNSEIDYLEDQYRGLEVKVLALAIKLERLKLRRTITHPNVNVKVA